MRWRQPRCGFLSSVRGRRTARRSRVEGRYVARSGRRAPGPAPRTTRPYTRGRWRGGRPPGRAPHGARPRPDLSPARAGPVDGEAGPRLILLAAIGWCAAVNREQTPAAWITRGLITVTEPH